jgi:O-antigen ligase
MDAEITKSNVTDWITHGLYLLFFTSLIFSLRAVTSISIAAILIMGITSNRSRLLSFFKYKYRGYFLSACVLLFLLQVISLLYTNDINKGLSNIRIKAGLFIIPLMICLSSYLQKSTLKKLLSQYCLLLLAGSFYCLFISFLNYQKSGNNYTFFYHSLVSPLSQHAVYFSLLVMIGLIFLMENIGYGNTFYPVWVHRSQVVYFSGFLFLLSSKLVISFYIIYLIYWSVCKLKKRKTILFFFSITALAVVLIFVTKNPISHRFSEIVSGNVKIVAQDSFKQSDYFNGLQFRLLQWKFVPEILTENKSWWIGVSAGDAQHLLNEKYISKHMYSGDPVRGSRGYLVYNTHNQFLQTLLQTGIIGLIVLLAFCFFLIKLTVQLKTRINSAVVLLLMIWLFTEAAFETQYGILIFTFFPLFLMAEDVRSKPPAKANLLRENSD